MCLFSGREVFPQDQHADDAHQQAQRARDDRQDEEGADPLRVVFTAMHKFYRVNGQNHSEGRNTN